MFSPWNLRCLSVRVWAYSPDERTSCWPGPGRCAACGTWRSKCWTRPCTSAAARPWWWWCRPWNVTIYNTDHLSDQHTTAIKNQCLYKRGNNSGRQRMSFVSEWVSHPSLASSEVTSGCSSTKTQTLFQSWVSQAGAGPRLGPATAHLDTALTDTAATKRCWLQCSGCRLQTRGQSCRARGHMEPNINCKSMRVGWAAGGEQWAHRPRLLAQLGRSCLGLETQTLGNSALGRCWCLGPGDDCIMWGQQAAAIRGILGTIRRGRRSLGSVCDCRKRCDINNKWALNDMTLLLI